MPLACATAAGDGGRGQFQGIIEFELLPFVAAHLVKRQNPPPAPPRPGDSANSATPYHLFVVIGQAGDQNIAKPHGAMKRCKPPAKLDNGLVVDTCGNAFVLLRAKGFHVQDDKVDVGEFFVR